jgi:hypothetical protein
VGVYVIATTRRVSNRATLAQRQHLHWCDLDKQEWVEDEKGACNRATAR